MALNKEKEILFWRKHFLGWKVSGQTQVKYCIEQKISVHILRKHICLFKKLDREKGQSRFVAVLNKSSEAAKIPEQRDESTPSPLRLHLSTRFSIEIPSNFSEVTLIQTIRVLEAM
jgi:hypothetical protein